MNTFERALAAGRELGWTALFHYARYQLALRSGWLRSQTPVYDWRDRPPLRWVTDIAYKPLGMFICDPGQLHTIGALNHTNSIQAAEEIADGRFSLFGLPPVQLRFPPDWWAYPPLGEARGDERLPLDHHWSAINLDQISPDIKLCWELSRFGWVFPLARAYASSGDDKYVHLFMQLLRNWRSQNQPNNGIHWVSAQEVAIRILALCLAACAFQPALDQIPGADEIILQTVAVHAARIPPSLAYARAQNNNHLLSEAAGLLTAGLIYPQLKHAKAWTELGWRTFIHALDRQVFDDGGYIQHSTNYHRLALQLGLWVARLGEANDRPLPGSTRAKLGRLTTALAALVDPVSGQAPNFGPNDGAHILPFSQCHFSDFRPTLQAASRLFHNQDAYPPGPWDEESRWYGLPQTQPQNHADRPPVDFPEYGLYLLRTPASWCMLRAARFRSRPGHSDQLQFDLWRRGENLVRDAGTYLYNGQPPWDNRLGAAAVHNSAIIDGQEPMRRGGRFLWLNWDQARFLYRESSTDGRLEAISAERFGFRRMGLTHRRTVVRAGKTLWLVVDDLLGEGLHTLRLAWLLPDTEWRMHENSLYLPGPGQPWRIQMGNSPDAAGLYQSGTLIGGQSILGDPTHLGWFAWTYAHKEPALHWLIQFGGELPLRTMTWFVLGKDDPQDITLEWADHRLEVGWQGSSLAMTYPPPGAGR